MQQTVVEVEMKAVLAEAFGPRFIEDARCQDARQERPVDGRGTADKVIGRRRLSKCFLVRGNNIHSPWPGCK